MRFGTFLLRVDGIRDAEKADFEQIISTGSRIYLSDSQKYLFVIEKELIDDRFFWMSCEYDDASRFRDYVVDAETGQLGPNPRTKNQIEPRQQLFVCYDLKSRFLFVSDMNRQSFIQKYFSETTQKAFYIQKVYTSVDEFCSKIKSIRGFKYVQVDNLYARNGDIFKQISDMWGMDTPSKVQMKVSYGDIPVHRGRALIDRFHRDKNEFENVIIIGCDNEGVEQTFDFSTVIRHITVNPTKDENEHFNPTEVKNLLLKELRRNDV